jgi:small conductance mechanosensitive channel
MPPPRASPAMLADLIHTVETLVPAGLAPFVARAVGLVLIVLLGLLAHLVIGFVLARVERVMLSERMLSKDERGEYAKRIGTVLKLLKTIALTLTWTIVLVTLLSHAGLNIAPILASAGIVGLAVGFGAQNLVRDVISGFFHILENQIRVGDVVRINGTGGLVEQITYRIIVLRDLEQAVHVIPHGKVEQLTNYTKDVSAMLIDVGVAYKEHPDVVIAALRDVAQTMMDDPEWNRVLLEPLEVLGVDAFGDSAVLYRVRYKTLPIEQWSVKREFQRRLKIEFDRRGIEFPFPHRTLYLAEGSAPVQVRLLPAEPAPDATPGPHPEPQAKPRPEPERA